MRLPALRVQETLAYVTQLLFGPECLSWPKKGLRAARAGSPWERKEAKPLDVTRAGRHGVARNFPHLPTAKRLPASAGCRPGASRGIPGPPRPPGLQRLYSSVRWHLLRSLLWSLLGRSCTLWRKFLLSDCLNFRRCMRCLGQLLFHACSSWRMQICQRHDFSFSSLSRSWGANSGARGMRL